MMHSPIQLQDIALSFLHKICFEGLTTQIHYGSRIAIIGQNGCGKSTLLKILQGSLEPTSGGIKIPNNVRAGYVPQVIERFEDLSGGQRLNKAFTQALSINPNVLLLDEPTNHLDMANRKSIMRLLKAFRGTLVVVSHDVELLQNCVDTLWYIDNRHVHLFSGNYVDFIREINIKRSCIEKELISLNRQKKDMHQALMKEQKRAAQSKAKGEKNIHQRKWPTIVSTAKAGRAAETSGRKKSAIDHKKQALTEQLSNLRLPEIIVPKFSLNSADVRDRIIVSISDGSIGYAGKKPLLQKISLSMGSRDRVSIQGDNASGKSTFIKAILDNGSVIKSGNWHTPKVSGIGYLDQHYGTLSAEKTVLETISDLAPTWPHIEIRRHLSDFLFRKNEEVNSSIYQLSGGEKARLSLAQIAIHTPKLLILDEITNNLDLETKEHVAQVLKAYPGALIIISHDADFLDKININRYLKIKNGILSG